MSTNPEHTIDADQNSAVLVVEGGGLRAFGAGVIEELSRSSGINFSDVIAVSSGAPTAAYWVAGQIGDGVRIWQEHTHGTQLISPANLLRGVPLMDIDRLVSVFDRAVPLDRARLGNASTRCWVVVTNCLTGRAEYIQANSSNVLTGCSTRRWRYPSPMAVPSR